MKTKMLKSPSVRKMGQNYLAIKKTFLKNCRFVSRVKTAFAAFLLLVAVGFYGYFINISSTKGYFLKQQKQVLQEIAFQNEIVKIDVRKVEGQLLDDAALLSSNTDQPLSGKVLFINPNSELTMN